MPIRSNEIYDVYVILGDPTAIPLWKWSAWKRLFPALDELIFVGNGKEGVFCHQYFNDLTHRVKFGRLRWKTTDHRKWSHGTPENCGVSSSWEFLRLAVSVPIWTICKRESRTPDISLVIANVDYLDGRTAFNPVIILALKSRIATLHSSLVKQALSAMKNITRAKLIGFRQDVWLKSESDGFHISLDYPCLSGLFQRASLKTSESLNRLVLDLLNRVS